MFLDLPPTDFFSQAMDVYLDIETKAGARNTIKPSAAL